MPLTRGVVLSGNEMRQGENRKHINTQALPGQLTRHISGIGGEVVRYSGSRIDLASDLTSSKGQKGPDISYMLHCL